MTDSFTRPYVDESGPYRRVIYLTDQQFAEVSKHREVRRLIPGEEIPPIVEGDGSIAPEVIPTTQVVPSPATRQAADTVLGDPVAHPVPEVRERETP